MKAVDRVLWVAALLEGAGENPPGSNRGRLIERFQTAGGGKPGDPWCMDFVQFCGWTVLEDAWPLHRTGLVQAAYNQGAKAEWIRQSPERGDILCKWYPALTPARFGHTGFVLGPGTAPGTWETVEGNTTEPRKPGDPVQREGWIVRRGPRTFAPADRFIRLPWPAGDTW